MSTHTVFRLTHRNGFDGIEASTEAIPEFDRHELLIKVRSVALNFRDIAIATSKYPFPVQENVTPCSDAMGEVVEVGASVPGFEKGDPVIVAFDPTALYGTINNWNNGLGGPVDGVLKQYICVSHQGVIKIPKESSLKEEQWAALVCTGVTAWNALYGNIPLRPGQTVLFQGTGGVSVTGLALGKAAGAKTIITSSSDEKLNYVQSTFGADYTINYKTTPDWAAEVQKITNGVGFDYILENGGSGTIKQSIEAIKFGGIISVIGFLSRARQEEMPDVAALALSKGCVVRGIIIGSKQQLEEVVRFVGSHDLKIPVEKTFEFSKEGVVDALKYMTSGSRIGKVCIKVG
ncbi:hypothetical protein M409DRAFT_30383 [Zasmidium cellare ATCC 36951]|uniref:Enoyl reductase (ER) domain-containing protein n=1 Tax=Zasmidium cellare ATCC 36951 TaxID=1080233 RepID=A0A6A6BZT9_ZASCE|nr:uncharacterized protein M409DRAFT_30383 [Zasmidium cellare ATCC 36951]KAF2159102.1 hypothetical protein M409DRAFT_30383 [Zasmidium cellare ATCC 36951]